MVVDLNLQLASSGLQGSLPSYGSFLSWSDAAISPFRKRAEVTIRIVDEKESRTLNHEYRGKDQSTNVLSFPFQPHSGIDVYLLGDIVICHQVVEREVERYGYDLSARWARLVIHGSLHLLGYDHISDGDAREMEGIESHILLKLGF